MVFAFQSDFLNFSSEKKPAAIESIDKRGQRLDSIVVGVRALVVSCSQFSGLMSLRDVIISSSFVS